MFKTLKENVILPLSTRLGSVLAGTLAPFGVHAETAQMLAIGIVAVGLLAVDLVLAQLRKRKLIDDVLIGRLR